MRLLLVTGLRRSDPIGPVLAALDWPGTGKLIALRDTVSVHRAMYDSDAPVSLRAMSLPRSAVSERVTRATVSGASVLHLPNLRLSCNRRLFPYRAAVTWNSLPRHLTGSASRRAVENHNH